MRHTIRIAAVVALLALAAGVAAAEDTPAPAAASDDANTLYAMGYLLASQAGGVELSGAELTAVERGMKDALTGKGPSVAIREYGPKVQQLVQQRTQEATARRHEASSAFVAEQAKQSGAVTTESGAIYIPIEQGSGESPGPDSSVTINYHGTLPDGTVFDSTRGKEPATFSVQAVVPCFAEGVRQMKVGGKAKLVCPPETAWGDRGSPPFIRPGAAVVFEVELLDVKAQETAAAPESTPTPTPTPTPAP